MNKSRSVAWGAASTLTSEAVGRGAAMAFQLLVANQLGANQYGLVALALASAALLSPLADSGLANLALREVSGNPNDDGIVRRLIGLKVALTPVFLAPLTIWAVILGDEPDKRWPLVWAGLFYGFQAASDLFRQILRARQETSRELAARFAFPAGNLAALFFVWHFRPGPTGALLALASGPMALTLSYLLAFPVKARAWEFGRGVAELARRNKAMLLQSIAYLFVVGFATRIDAFILEHHAGRSEVGRYFAASNLVTAGGFFGQGLSSFLYPRLHRQTNNHRRALLRSATIQGALGITLLGGVVMLGPFVFELVFQSKSFSGAATLLPGMGLILALATLDWLWLSVLIGRDRTWIAALNLIPVLACKLLLAPLWVPEMGAQGMVWASLIGQAITCMFGAITAYFAFVPRSPTD